MTDNSPSLDLCLAKFCKRGIFSETICLVFQKELHFRKRSIWGNEAYCIPLAELDLNVEVRHLRVEFWTSVFIAVSTFAVAALLVLYDPTKIASIAVKFLLLVFLGSIVSALRTRKATKCVRIPATRIVLNGDTRSEEREMEAFVAVLRNQIRTTR